MCVALPGRIVSVSNSRGVAETIAGRREISLAALPDAAAGDHVLISLGMGLTRISEAESRELEALWAAMNGGDRRDEIDE